jgi:putative SOS response-associated peptidase YedK
VGFKSHIIARADYDRAPQPELYETWWDKSRSSVPDPETLLRTCTIMTTDAGPDMVEVHNRMPVIIERDDIDAWLDPKESDTNALLTYLEPARAGTLTKYPVSRMVNSPQNDGSQIIQRPREPEQ